jgi:hypothetical protein
MPKLTGSDKQVEWARRVRRDLLVAGHDWWLDAGRDEGNCSRARVSCLEGTFEILA